jgi:hypothetical protein
MINKIDFKVERISKILNYLDHKCMSAFIVPQGNTAIMGKHNIIDAYYHFKEQNILENWLDYQKSHYFRLFLYDLYEAVFSAITLYKMKMYTSAIALTRKPFSDTLNYLEWLLLDHRELLINIFEGDIKDYCIDRNIDPTKRKSNYNKLINKFDNLDVKKFIAESFEKRYNPKSKITMKSIWDQSLHIVTTNTNYKTPVHHFNYITYDDEFFRKILSYFLLNLNFLLDYTYFIVKEILLVEIKDEHIQEFDLNFLNNTFEYVGFDN